MVQAGDAALDGFFGVTLEQCGSCAVADVQDHGVVVGGREADGPILGRKKHVDFGSAEFECVSFPMAHDFDAEGVGFGDQALQGSTGRKQANP